MEANTDCKTNSHNYVELYLESLTSKEMKAYGIAKAHLGSTFDITKSVGYCQFVKEFAR